MLTPGHRVLALLPLRRQHEREADEVAAAVLTRLRVPPSKVPTAAQAALHAEQELAAVVLWSR